MKILFKMLVFVGLISLIAGCSCRLEDKKMKKEMLPIAEELHAYLKKHGSLENIKEVKNFSKKLYPCTPKIEECVDLEKITKGEVYYYTKGKENYAIAIYVVREQDIERIIFSMLHHSTYGSSSLEDDDRYKDIHLGLKRGCQGVFRQ